MAETFLPEKVDLEILEKMETGKPVAIYKKTILGKVGVTILNPLTLRPEGRILSGDPFDKNTNIEDITIKIWTESAHTFFKNMNKRLIEQGLLVPYNPDEDKEEKSVNAISDEEIEKILEEPFFTLKNKLDTFTSSIPVERILRAAIAANKGAKTLQAIQNRLVELQKEEGLDNSRLDNYYKNIVVE